MFLALVDIAAYLTPGLQHMQCQKCLNSALERLRLRESVFHTVRASEACPWVDAKASISSCAPQSHRVLPLAMQDLAAEVQEQLEGTSVYLVGMMGRYGRSSAHFTCALLFLQYAAHVLHTLQPNRGGGQSSELAVAKRAEALHGHHACSNVRKQQVRRDVSATILHEDFTPGRDAVPRRV